MYLSEMLKNASDGIPGGTLTTSQSLPSPPGAALALCFLSLSIGCQGVAPEKDSQLRGLEQQIEARLGEFSGVVGIFYRSLESSDEIAIRADETFPTASLIKIPILITVMEKIRTGHLKWHSKHQYTKDREYPGEDMLASFRDGAEISLSKIVDLMIRYSDNTASLWCQELGGTGTELNRWLSQHGFEKTRVNSRTPGREEFREEWGWGQTTPREMAQLLTRIWQRQCVRPDLDERMLRILSGSYWREEMLSSFPPEAQVFSKQGAVNQSRSEVVLVAAPDGPFVLCVITKDQQDTGWEHDNDGFVLLRDIAKLCWQHNAGPELPGEY